MGLYALTSEQIDGAIALEFQLETDPYYSWDRDAHYGTSKDYANLYENIFKIDLLDDAQYSFSIYSYFEPYSIYILDSLGVINYWTKYNSYSPYSETLSIYKFDPPYTGTYYLEAHWQQGSYHDYVSISAYEYGYYEASGEDAPGQPGDNIPIPTKPSEVITEPTEQDYDFYNYFLLQIDSPLSVDATVSYRTKDGTAIEGEDYIAAYGKATIKAGELSTVIPVTILGDDIIEGNETFELVIANPTGASFPEGETELSVVRTIIDDDNSAQAYHLDQLVLVGSPQFIENYSTYPEFSY